jgi:peptidoglycan L-alanyl-D-glutamate endopeptidase CwlK
MIDSRSAKVISTLLLKVQPTFANLLIELKKRYQEKGLECKFISGTRTYEEQAAIYAQGRTAPGPKVSNARPGFSNHNFGIAVDVGLFLPDGRYLEDSPFYRELGKIVATFPTLEWGGDWKFVDEPHIQWKTGLTMTQMRERVAAGKSIVT